MQIISTGTNVTVAGYAIPYGAYSFPLEGSIGVVTSAGSTNLVVGSGDTLIVWQTGAAVEPGPELWNWFAYGLFLVWVSLGVIIIGRRFARLLGKFSGVGTGEF